MRWEDTDNIGRSGFVQSRLVSGRWWAHGRTRLAEIQYHAPDYAVWFLEPDNVNNYPRGFAYFATLDEAKAWAQAIVKLGD